MRAARIALASACLLAARRLSRRAAAAARSSTDSSSTAAEAAPKPPGAAEERVSRAPTAARLGELIKMRRRPLRTDRRTGRARSSTKARTATRSGSSNATAPQIPDAEVALYFAKVPRPKPGARSKPGSKGPVAKAQAASAGRAGDRPLPGEDRNPRHRSPPSRAKTTADDPDAASVVYSTQIDFPSDGEWRIAALIKEGDETTATLLPSAEVGEFTGDPAARRDGAADPHPDRGRTSAGTSSKITTRIPPDTQNKVDYAEALGKEPILLLFATPKFCQSRVCGPVVDVAEQAQQEFGDKAAFIHMEIYNDNDPARACARRCGPSTCPASRGCSRSTAKGVVSAAIEGAFGLELMDEVVEKVVAE